MKPTVPISLSRHDFGFVVARVLACFMAFQSMRTAIALGALIIQTIVDKQFRLSDISQTLIIESVGLLAVAFFAAQLWIRAERFGRTAEDNSEADRVTLSRNSLFHGVAFGLLGYVVFVDGRRLFQVLYWIINPSQNRGPFPIQTQTVIESLITLAAVVGLVVYTSRAAKQEDAIVLGDPHISE